jgi:hypothetical protein
MMPERDSRPDGHLRNKARAKAAGAPRRRKHGGIARAFDLVSLSVAIWLCVLVAAEGMQKLGEMAPDQGMTTTSPVLQHLAPMGLAR